MRADPGAKEVSEGSNPVFTAIEHWADSKSKRGEVFLKLCQRRFNCWPCHAAGLVDKDTNKVNIRISSESSTITNLEVVAG
jgi:hypothetical protein